MADRVLTNKRTGQVHNLDELLEVARQKEPLDEIQLEALIVGMQRYRSKAVAFGADWHFELLSLNENEPPRPDMSRIYCNGKIVETLNFSFGIETHNNLTYNVVHLTVPMSNYSIDKKVVSPTFMAHRDILELSEEFGIDLAHYVQVPGGGDNGSDRAG